MKWFLLIILLLTGCTAVSDIAQPTPTVETQGNVTPRLHPSPNHVAGNVVLLPTTKNGRQYLEVVQTKGDIGAKAIVGVSAEIPVFVSGGVSLQTATLADIKLADHLLIYFDGTISSTGPIAFKAAEIVVVK